MNDIDYPLYGTTKEIADTFQIEKQYQSPPMDGDVVEDSPLPELKSQDFDTESVESNKTKSVPNSPQSEEETKDDDEFKSTKRKRCGVDDLRRNTLLPWESKRLCVKKEVDLLSLSNDELKKKLKNMEKAMTTFIPKDQVQCEEIAASDIQYCDKIMKLPPVYKTSMNEHVCLRRISPNMIRIQSYDHQIELPQHFDIDEYRMHRLFHDERSYAMDDYMNPYGRSQIFEVTSDFDAMIEKKGIDDQWIPILRIVHCDTEGNPIRKAMKPLAIDLR